MDKNSKQFKIINEIVNDAFWLGYILEIKRALSDNSKKEILSSFLIFFSSIFVEETLKAKYGGLSGKRQITVKDIENFRNHNLKYCPSENSNDTKTTLKEMGIDFDNYIFDLVLSLGGNDLLDINFRNWDLNKESNFELLDGIVATPLRWIEILMPDIFEELKKVLLELMNTNLDRINSIDIKQKSYASYKMFKKTGITNNDKLYILQRYGLVKTIMFIDNIMQEKISFNIGNLHFDFEHFIVKMKAIIIEMFWNDRNSNNTVLNRIFQKNKQNIDDDFYPINRKCRNNLHYSDYHFISEKDKGILLKYQNTYLHNILFIFNSNITYNFGWSYNLGLTLAKLQYWSNS
ncbi:MAG: hypothetical protein RR144_02045 [Clostridia bacterium]